MNGYEDTATNTAHTIFYQTYLVLAAYDWVGNLVVPQEEEHQGHQGEGLQGGQEDLVGGLQEQELQENGCQGEGLQGAQEDLGGGVQGDQGEGLQEEGNQGAQEDLVGELQGEGHQGVQVDQGVLVDQV